MPTTYTPAPVEDTPPAAVYSITYTVRQTSGAQPQQTTVAYPIVA